MTSGLQEIEPVLSTIDNALARKRILLLVMQGGRVPQATYDFQSSRHYFNDGLLHVILSFFLPIERKVQRQSAIIGEDLYLNVHVWVMPLHVSARPSIVKYEASKSVHEVHIIAPLKEDLTGIIW